MKLGAVIIPGVGFFIRSRAFLRDLLLEKDSPGLCGDAKALMALGFSASEARQLEAAPNESGVMVYVTCSEHSSADQAVEVLRRSGARTAASAGNDLILKMRYDSVTERAATVSTLDSGSGFSGKTSLFE